MPHLPDGSTGITHLALAFSDASLIFSLVFSVSRPDKKHCSTCARTAERLEYLELEFTDYFQAVAQHPAYWTEGHVLKTTCVALGEIFEAAKADSARERELHRRDERDGGGV